MMEPTATMGKPPLQSPRTNQSTTTSNIPANNPNLSAPAAAQPAPERQGSKVQVPKVLVDKADDLAQRISTTDIARINGYMRLANLVGAGLLWVTCFIRMFQSPSYSHFLVVAYIMLLAAGLAFIENHERFPSQTEKVKMNFGFMFTAKGKAAYILCIAFLAFSQGWIGTLIGIFFLFLALFNFFLIHRHPAYRSHMTKTEMTSTTQEPDLEGMPELRYNQSQSAQAHSSTTTTTATKTAHVVV